MSTNYDKIRKKLDALKKGKSTNSNTDGPAYYKPTDMDKIRFVVREGEDDPVKEYFWHYKIGGEKVRSFLCAKKSYGGDHKCAICEAGSELWNSFEESKRTNKQVGDAAKKLFASSRFYTPVILRGKESDGVLIYGYGKEVATSLMGNLVNDEYDFSVLHPLKGRDFTVSVTKKTSDKGSEYQSVAITPSPKVTPITNPEDLASLLESIPDIHNLYPIPNEEEVLASLTQHLDSVLATAEMALPSEGGEDAEQDPVAAAMSKLG
jgi:hypothetical protein